MKHIIAAVLLLMVLAAPAAAALKELPEPLAQELQLIAKEHVVARENISLDKITVSEAWVRELRAIGKDIYMVTVLGNDTKFMVTIEVSSRKVLNAEEFEALVKEDTEKTPADAVYTLSLPATSDGDEVTTMAPARDLRAAYVAGVALVLLGLGTVHMKIRKRV
ncbi:MAG: hypothetical protein AB1445_05855 [Bacillota bacterium]